MPYDIESQSRNADFISIAAKRQYRNPRDQRPRQTYEPLGRRPIHLKNLFPQPFYTTCGASRAPFFKICGVSRYHHSLNLLNLLNPMNPGHRVALCGP